MIFFSFCFSFFPSISLLSFEWLCVYRWSGPHERRESSIMKEGKSGAKINWKQTAEKREKESIQCIQHEQMFVVLCTRHHNPFAWAQPRSERTMHIYTSHSQTDTIHKCVPRIDLRIALSYEVSNDTLCLWCLASDSISHHVSILNYKINSFARYWHAHNLAWICS